MKAAEANGLPNQFSDFYDPLAPPHYTTAPCASLSLQQGPNNDIMASEGAVYLKRGSIGQGSIGQGSVGQGSEDAYVVMDERADNTSQANTSDIFLDNSLPRNDRASGESHISIC